jgi:hypothetical protein
MNISRMDNKVPANSRCMLKDHLPTMVKLSQTLGKNQEVLDNFNLSQATPLGPYSVRNQKASDFVLLISI